MGLKVEDKILKEYTLLYAEDDSQLRENYSYLFSKYFKKVYQAADGLEALDLYNRHLPDILVSDISMPNMDGLTLAKKIREHDSVMRIIILSAHGDQDKLLSAVKLQLVDYLLKPVKRSVLMETLISAVQSYPSELQQNRPTKLCEEYIWLPSSKELLKDSQKVHLTKKEQVLLSLLFSNTDQYFSVDTIKDHFFTELDEAAISLESLRSVIKRLKPKLPANCIQNEFGVGYKIQL